MVSADGWARIGQPRIVGCCYSYTYARVYVYWWFTHPVRGWLRQGRSSPLNTYTRTPAAAADGRIACLGSIGTMDGPTPQPTIRVDPGASWGGCRPAFFAPLRMDGDEQRTRASLSGAGQVRNSRRFFCSGVSAWQGIRSTRNKREQERPILRWQNCEIHAPTKLTQHNAHRRFDRDS